MKSYLTTNSPYFSSLNLAEKDKAYLAFLIDAACQFVEKFCNRKFAKDTYDHVFASSQNGSNLLLANYPIQSVERVCRETNGFITIQRLNAEVATYSLMYGVLTLYGVSNGVASTTRLQIVDTPTLATLATAIELAGWKATIDDGKGNYPTADLVQNHQGLCIEPCRLGQWVDMTSSIDIDTETGILTGDFGRWQRYRVVYDGGYTDVPEALKQATASMVVASYSGSPVKSETIGGYSYTLEDVEKLTMADRKILSHYKERIA